MSAKTQEVETPEPAGRRRWVTLVLAVFALGLVLRLPTFFRPLLSDDEAIYATTADALARGDLLYRDVVDHKPPLIYHVYRAGFALLGAYNTHGAHALVVLSVLLTAAFLFAAKSRGEAPSVARREPSREGLGTLPGFPDQRGEPPSVARREPSQEGTAAVALATAGLYLVFSTTWHDYDALAANCELFALLPQSIAAWLLLRGFEPARSTARDLVVHLGIGLLIGLSALCKYQALTFLGVSIGMLVWSFLLGRLRGFQATVRAGCHLVGALVPAAVYLGGCAVAGNLDAALYWFRFNFSYVEAGLQGTTAIARGLGRTIMIGGAALLPYALGIAGAAAAAAGVARVVRRRMRREPLSERDLPSPASVLALLWLATSAVAVSAGGRFFGHYFHLVLPPLCLFAAPRLLAGWRKGRAFRVALALLWALPPLIFFGLATFARPLAVALDETEPDYAEVAARMAALAPASERVFVWGNSPQLYVLARRPMGSRFSFCNYMTGESPGTPTETGRWNADANQLPAAWDMLFSDLDARQPTLFVDAAAAGWDGYDKFPIARYPRLSAYLERHYYPVETHQGVVIYRRTR